MGIEENKALIHRFYELYNQQELDACDEILADSAFSENYTREFNRRVDIALFKAFPDLKATVLEMIAEGDRVAYVRIITGTHTGEPFRGIPATGKKVEIKTAIFARITDNKIVGGNMVNDPMVLWQPLGVLPTIPEAIQAYKEAHNI